MRRLCVFAGARPGRNHDYARDARELGHLLAKRGVTLVYGGASIGLMGVIADAVLELGGEAIGVIPQSLVERELAHPHLTELKTVSTMHERKATMTELSDAFVALPGGLGTLDELFEAVTWRELGIHAKPCGALNTSGYWDVLIAHLDRAAAESFLRGAVSEMLTVEREPAVLLDRLGQRLEDRLAGTPAERSG